MESRAPDAVLGVVSVVTTYSDYRDFGGVKFPTRITQSQGGYPVLDVTVKEVQPNAPADIQLPDAVKTATERVTAEKVAEGVWWSSPECREQSLKPVAEAFRLSVAMAILGPQPAAEVLSSETLEGPLKLKPEAAAYA